MKEWRRVFEEQFSGRDLPNLVSENEFSEDGLLSSYFRKF